MAMLRSAASLSRAARGGAARRAWSSSSSRESAAAHSASPPSSSSRPTLPLLAAGSMCLRAPAVTRACSRGLTRHWAEAGADAGATVPAPVPAPAGHSARPAGVCRRREADARAARVAAGTSPSSRKSSSWGSWEVSLRTLRRAARGRGLVRLGSSRAGSGVLPPEEGRAEPTSYGPSRPASSGGRCRPARPRRSLSAATRASLLSPAAALLPPVASVRVGSSVLPAQRRAAMACTWESVDTSRGRGPRASACSPGPTPRESKAPLWPTRDSRWRTASSTLPCRPRLASGPSAPQWRHRASRYREGRL